MPGTSEAFKVGLFYSNTTDVPVNYYNDVTNSGDVFGLSVISGSPANGSSYTYFSEFNSYPFVESGIDDTICANLPFVDLQGVVSRPITTGIWSVGKGVYNTSNTQLNTQYTPSAAEISNGSVFIILISTNNNSCNAVSDNVQILFVAPPFDNFNYNEIYLNKTTVLTDFSLPCYGSISNWAWDFGDGTTSTNQNNTYDFTSHVL